jgi:hypothetical protein
MVKENIKVNTLAGPVFIQDRRNNPDKIELSELVASNGKCLRKKCFIRRPYSGILCGEGK